MGGREIATALNISESRLGRMFKAVKGVSLVDYRNRLRLERFVALLDRGGTNLLDAALEAGFGSYSHFHRVFRARLHATPREYLRPSSGERSAPRLLETIELGRPVGRGRRSSD